jgi:phosphatidylglycerol:prolipoprotein diacylglycerol transferase
MFIHNINPVLLTLGPFEIRYYGIIYALGFVLAYLFLRTAVKTGKLKIEMEALDEYLIMLIIGVIVGARIFEVIFFSPGYYIQNPSEILMIWHGGLSFHGGLVGAGLMTWLFAKRHKIKFYDIADIVVIPTALALAFGRIANFINAEHYGKITDAVSTPWCVVFSRVDEYCRHPSQLYESLKNFFIFGFLLVYKNIHEKKKKSLKSGTMFWLFVLLYGILRFLVNFYRDDPTVLGVSMGQLLSLLMVVTAVIFLFLINSNNSNNSSSAKKSRNHS